MLNASGLVVFGMLTLGVLVAALFAWANGVVDPKRKWLGRGAITAWVVLVSALALVGVYERWEVPPPPPMMITIVLLIVACGVLAMSGQGKRLAGLPLFMLVGLHAFRLPLEMVMHRAYSEGVMPVQMSWSGRNFDVVTGVTAIVLAFLLLRRQLPKAVVIAWNALGSALLLNIMAIAIASTPTVNAFGELQQNTWIAYFPAVLLPTVLVPVALIGHLVLWRRLLQKTA